MGGGITNKPSLNQFIKFDYDYMVEVDINVNNIVHYSAYTNGIYNTTTGVYTGGTLVGDVYIKYTSVARTNWTNVYVRKA